MTAEQEIHKNKLIYLLGIMASNDQSLKVAHQRLRDILMNHPEDYVSYFSTKEYIENLILVRAEDEKQMADYDSVNQYYENLRSFHEKQA